METKSDEKSSEDEDKSSDEKSAQPDLKSLDEKPKTLDESLANLGQIYKNDDHPVMQELWFLGATMGNTTMPMEATPNKMTSGRTVDFESARRPGSSKR